MIYVVSFVLLRNTFPLIVKGHEVDKSLNFFAVDGFVHKDTKKCFMLKAKLNSLYDTIMVKKMKPPLAWVLIVAADIMLISTLSVIHEICKLAIK